MKKSPSRLNLAVKGILTAIAFLLVLEGTARIAKTVRDDLRNGPDQWYEYSSDLGWQRRPGFRGQIFDRPVAFDAHGYLEIDSAQTADNSIPRVLTLGDSVTFGYGVNASETFSEQLDTHLPEAAVINLGVNGYSSFQSERAMEIYAARLKPSLIVLSGQYNDRRYMLADDEIDSAEHFSLLARRYRMRKWGRNIYLVRGLGLMMDKAGILPHTEDPDRPNAGRETIDHPVNLEEVPTRVEPERYREQLTKAARWCRQQSIPLVFMTLTDNSHMIQPIEEAVRAEKAGDIPAAIASLESLLEPKGIYTAMARRMLANLYRTQGRDADAESIASVDRPLYTLHGGFAIYRAAVYNRIMREVAASENVPLADAALWLKNHNQVFIDQCHFNPDGHAGVASILADKIAELKLEKLGPVDTFPPEALPADRP